MHFAKVKGGALGTKFLAISYISSTFPSATFHSYLLFFFSEGSNDNSVRFSGESVDKSSREKRQRRGVLIVPGNLMIQSDFAAQVTATGKRDRAN